MKNINLIGCILFMSLLTVKVSANPIKERNRKLNAQQLSVKGQALSHGKITSSYTVSVYLSGEKLETYYCKTKKPMFFNLNFGEVYSILYQKEGCDDKIIIIDTRIPDGLKTLDDDTHDFEIEMTQDLIKKSDEVEDFPVAILLLDKYERMLVLCQKYHNFIHQNDGYAYAPKM